MIVSRLVGGLGNQLFQFAAGLSLAIKHGTELRLDESGLHSVNNRGTGTSRLFELGHLIPSACLLQDSDLVGSLFRSAKMQGEGALPKLKYLLFEISEMRKGRKATLISESFSSRFADSRLTSNQSSNLYIAGYWNRVHLFEGYRPEILKLILPVNIPQRLSDLAREMSALNSGVLHVRRTDFVSAYASTHGVTTLRYFSEGIRLLKVLCDVVYVFSDDIQWCRERFPPSEKVVFVERHKDEHDSAHLWAMTHGKHFVISNSSFSWWAAWLSQGQDKIVYRPPNWVVGDKDGGGTYPQEWRTIEC